MAMLLPFLYGNMIAQTSHLKPLLLNQKLPGLIVTMVNGNKPTAKLSDCKNKLLILDFWSTICSSCTHHFAELDSLQRLFGDSIMILPVSCTATGDNAGTVTRFIQGYRQRINNGFILSSVVNDVVLNRLFPHNTLPHFVWINKGVYIGATAAEEVTVVNIRNVIYKQTVPLQQKTNKAFFDITKPLLAYSNTQGIVSRSVLTHYISGLESSLGFTHNPVTGPKLYAINFTGLGLYKFAWAGAAYLPRNRIINQVDNNNALFKPFSAGNDENDLYCYELTATGMNDEMMRRRMQQDVSDYFHVQARLENRNIQCLVLQIADTALLVYGKGIPGNSLYDDIKTERMIINQPVSELMERLNELSLIPVIDETGITKNINLKLPNDLSDSAALTAILKAQGIAVTTGYRNLEMFVVEDASVVAPPANDTSATR